MKYDKEKVDQTTLALMWLVTESDKYGSRAWKGFEQTTREGIKSLIQSERQNLLLCRMRPLSYPRSYSWTYSEYHTLRSEPF